MNAATLINPIIQRLTGSAALEERRARLIIWLLAAGLLVSVLAMVAMVLFTRAGLDKVSESHERTLMQSALAHTLEEQSIQLTTVTAWDEARQKVGQASEQVWVHENIGRWLNSFHGYPVSLIQDRAGRIIYASRDGQMLPLRQAGAWIRTAKPIMATAARSDFSSANVHHSGTKRVYAASGIVLVEGRPYFLVAAPITNTFRIGRPLAGESSIVATFRPLDAKWLQLQSRHFMVSDIRYSPAPPASARPSVPILDIAGATIGYISWESSSPGGPFMKAIALPGLFVLASLLGLTHLLNAIGQRASRTFAGNEQRLRELAYTDSLTGLPNRAALLNPPGETLDTDAIKATMLIDLDHFKEINDTLGHAVGDQLIVDVGRRLRTVVGAGDMVVRLGGDEFAVIVRSVSCQSDIEGLSTRIILLLSEPFMLAGTEHYLSASVGVCLHRATPDGASQVLPQEYLRRADVALYRAKELGRARHVLFDPQFDVEALMRKKLETDFRQAISASDLTLVYQPQFCTSTMRMTGVETLVRWRHPTRGYISPMVFIPIAEETGLIREMGRMVLAQAMRQALRWPDLSVAVNVSTVQIRDSGFLRMLSSLLDEIPIPAERIELELTESVLLEQSNEIAETLSRIKAMGFRLALDDFGTGFSSLRYLSRYQFDKIKIDRGFVVDANQTMRAMGILRSVAAIGGVTGLKICAEGVETKEQFTMVAEIGCTEVQGYYFMRPQPAAEIDALLGVRPDQEEPTPPDHDAIPLKRLMA